MRKTKIKRPTDANQLAHSVVKDAVKLADTSPSQEKTAGTCFFDGAMQRWPVAFVILRPDSQSFGVRVPPGFDFERGKHLQDAAWEAASFFFTQILEEERKLNPQASA